MRNFQSDAVVPFLWVRNEYKELIEKEIDAIKALGIHAFMIESRPRVLSESDFGTNEWYTRVGNILAYARMQNMQVWLLDDRSFPTGSANGQMNLKYPHLRAKQLKCVAIDVVLKGEPSFVLSGVRENSQDIIICAGLIAEDKILPIETQGNERIVRLPELYGLYRVVFLVLTDACPERDGYIDMLNPESVDVLIQEVYQPHYERFHEYFGNTFVGYFSDEPRFANGINWHYGTPISMYDYKVGNPKVALPFSMKILEAFVEKGYQKEELIGLFFDVGNRVKEIRVDYMDLITQAYASNFVGKLTNWCNERGVRYSGHVIEDDGVHLTTGCGAGHYFRAVKNSDFPAVDVVLHQIKPFYTQTSTVSPIEGGFANSAFFNFTLAKLASSVAVQSSKANGRCFCEIFGAYGWGETISDMLYLVNHMAVRGINQFIPHAFSMDLYDKDCPPYFYGQGKNPSIDGYKILFSYMKFVSEISKTSFAKVAVFYNAESVWCGEEYISMDQVAKALTENQIEFDFIDEEYLKSATQKDGAIDVNGCVYQYLIVPAGYYREITKQLFDRVSAQVVFVDKVDLPNFVENIQPCYHLKKRSKGLRIKKLDIGVYMLFNEDLERIENELRTEEKLYLIDPFTKKVVDWGESRWLRFTLNPAQVLFAVTEVPEGYAPIEKLRFVQEVKETKVFIKAFDKDEFEFIGIRKIADGYNFCVENPDFSGFIRYVFEMDGKEEQYLSVDFYGEYLKINVNGETTDCVERNGTAKLYNGKNKIELIVCNTLANAMKDALSAYSNISACGIKTIKVMEKELVCIKNYL